MQALAFDIIANAAQAAGLDRAAVMDKPEKETVLLAERRVQVEFLPARLERSGRPVGKDRTDIDGHPHRSLRRAIYNRVLDVSAEIVGDDETWVEAFVVAFLRALPRRTADADNNLVTIEAHQAVRGGYTGKVVEVFVKRRCAVHIRFSGMVHADVTVPYVTECELDVTDIE
ncbi:MAG: hypothetical protein SWH61_05315 [Thermodesulfobacteriota bacterium]|nr:hypothetical protein [Thermodesulfobacteriota bacterium]